MDKKRAHLIIYGKVQGVFFRASTKDKAIELGLKGFVRNQPDGTVEVIAEGSEKQLQELVAWCHEGHGNLVSSCSCFQHRPVAVHSR